METAASSGVMKEVQSCSIKQEAIWLMRERGVSLARAARHLSMHQSLRGTCVRTMAHHPVHAFHALDIKGRKRRS